MYSVCVCLVLVIQHALYLSSVAYLVLPYFPTLSYNTIFKKQLLNIKCVFWFSLQLLFEKFFTFGRTEQDIVKMYICLLIIKFIENLYAGSWVVPCRWTVRRTDMTKLIVAFRYFANMPQCVMRTLSKPALEMNVICTWQCWYKLNAVKETQMVHTQVYWTRLDHNYNILTKLIVWLPYSILHKYVS